MSILSFLSKPKADDVAPDLSNTRWNIGWRDENDVFFDTPTTGHTVAEVFAELSSFLDDAATLDCPMTFFVERGVDADVEGGID